MYLGNDDRGIQRLEALLNTGEDIYWLSPKGTLHQCSHIVRDENGSAILFFTSNYTAPVDLITCENNQFIRLSRVLT